VARALTHLTPFERAVFCLRHHAELSVKEVAAMLERSEGTVKNIHFRAIHKLRDHLRDCRHLAVGGSR
jgi:RNA polymerase sigma-70 factor (ECF subfamily)